MSGTAPSLLREVAKAPVTGEASNTRDADSPAITGSITNFNTPQERPHSDTEQLEALRTSIKQAANGWATPDIEAIFSSPTEEFQQK